MSLRQSCSKDTTPYSAYGIAELMISIIQESSGRSEKRINSWCNVILQPLALTEKILLPTLHIKLAKQFIKALKSDSEAFKHVQAMLPKLSEAKVKGGIFIGPQIQQMLGSKELEGKMTALERDA